MRIQRLTLWRVAGLTLVACLSLLAVSGCGQSKRQGSPAGEILRVAAASDLRTVLPEIIAAFKQGHPQVDVQATFAASGTLYAQCEQGAPLDVFLSADRDYPQRLAEAGRALPDSLVVYARGRLVLWARSDSGFDSAAGLAGLDRATVRRIAIANPQHAPYGRAAEAALRASRIWSALEGRLVYADNVSQAAHFAGTGAVDAAFLSASAVAEPALAHGNSVAVPESLYPPIEQAAVVLRTARPQTGRMFVAFLGSEDARTILQRRGFALPASH